MRKCVSVFITKCLFFSFFHFYICFAFFAGPVAGERAGGRLCFSGAKVKIFFVAEGVFFSCERGGLAEVSRLSVSGVRRGYEKKVRKRYVM
jgi:hypothetical protein